MWDAQRWCCNIRCCEFRIKPTQIVETPYRMSGWEDPEDEITGTCPLKQCWFLKKWFPRKTCRLGCAERHSDDSTPLSIEP